jgi:uncharacterized membrane protein YecN with MAPEG domain
MKFHGFDMHLPIVTTTTAGVLGLVYLVLCGRVIAARFSERVLMGAGGEDSPLFAAFRSQANFAEYVPICLILIGLLELRSGATQLVEGLAVLLVVARIAHPVGMVMKAPNPFRAGGAIVTLLVLVVASVAALI